MDLNKLTKEEIQAFINDEGNDDYKLIKKTNWEHNSDKEEYQELIFQELATGKYYQTWQARSGSHWTDWYYTYPDKHVFTEVRQVTKQIVVWEPVNG